MRIKDKNIIITGAASGIGKATALLLAKHQANLAMIDNNREELIATEKEIRKNGGKCSSFHCDVGYKKQTQDTVEKIAAQFDGEIDVLINNAGILESGPIHTCSPESWIRVINTNLIGYFLCARYVLPYMIKQKKGRIINNSSYYGKRESADSSAYNATKFGIRGFSKAMKLEVGKYNIQVSTICESTTDTDLFKGTPWIPNPKTALKPEDIAKVIYQILTMRTGGVVEEIDIVPLKYPYMD